MRISSINGGHIKQKAHPGFAPECATLRIIVHLDRAYSSLIRTLRK